MNTNLAFVRLTVGHNCVLSDKSEYNSAVIALAVLDQTVENERYVLRSPAILQCKRDSQKLNNQPSTCRIFIEDLRVLNYRNEYRSGGKQGYSGSSYLAAE